MLVWKFQCLGPPALSHLHVRIGSKEGDDPVRHAGGRLEEQLAVVPHGGRLGPQVKLGREGRLRLGERVG